MDNNKNLIEKSKKIRELFGFNNKCVSTTPKKKINYNENVYFTSINEDKDQMSSLISKVINSINNDSDIKVNINVSQNYFESSIKYIVQDVNKLEVSPENINLHSIKSVFNNNSIDSNSTISTRVNRNNSLLRTDSYNNNQGKTYFFIPCINCNNLICFY